MAGGCATGARARPRSILDARAALDGQRAARPTHTATDVYRSLVAPTWGTRCRMLPTDATYFDRSVARCGAVSGLVAGVARLLLEVEATPQSLSPVQGATRVRWIDLPRGEACWP